MNNSRVGLWLLWVLMSTVGFALGGFLFHFPFGFSNTLSFDLENARGGFVQGAFTGVVIGTLQFLALRKVISGAGWWIVATLVGIGVVHAIGDSIPDTIAFWMLALPSGVLVGLLQWLVLYRSFSKAGWWVAATSVSWPFGLIVGMVIDQSTGLMLLNGPDGWAMQHSVVGAVTGAVVGTITGAVLVWLVDQPIEVRNTGEPATLNDK